TGDVFSRRLIPGEAGGECASVSMIVRPANLADAPELHAMIGELADYERLGDEARATVADTKRALFGESPAAEALIGEIDGAVAGFALFYPYYSTFAGRSG